MLSINGQTPSLNLPEFPDKWIEQLERPHWDTYFLAMAFLGSMRSPDQETKVGCVIADWKAKVILGMGYNGHPRGAIPLVDSRPGNTKVTELPTKRPEKYKCIVHADTNAAVNCQGASDNAVVYLPMPPCEVCLGVLANMPTIQVRRIVYLEYRQYHATESLLRHLPHIKMEQYIGEHPADLLLRAATYAKVRTTSGHRLSSDSVKSYVDARGVN